MARSKDGVNKSEAIRNAINANPDAKTSEIVKLLADQRVKVQPSLVYMVKSQMKHSQRKQKRERAATASRELGIGNPVDLLLKVRSLAGDAGGMKQLKKLVDLLAE